MMIIVPYLATSTIGISLSLYLQNCFKTSKGWGTVTSRYKQEQNKITLLYHWSIYTVSMLNFASPGTLSTLNHFE